jgi:hypothetical protein
LIREAHVTVRHHVEVEEEEGSEGNDEEEEGSPVYGPTGRTGRATELLQCARLDQAQS